MSLHWADLFILAVVGISALLSLFRGLVREVLSLLGWACAGWGAFVFASPLAARMAGVVEVPSARLALAFILLLVGILLAFALLNFLIGRLVAHTGLTATDRMLGVIFGVARGVAIATALVMIAGLTPLPRDPWWREPVLLPHVETLARLAISWLPPEFAGHFDYHQLPAAAAPDAGSS
ncbi:MAG: hypothetical protein RL434_2839 [Pseudomonadota bacterium]